jgi:hypothetical protein
MDRLRAELQESIETLKLSMKAAKQLRKDIRSQIKELKVLVTTVSAEAKRKSA